MIQSMTGYGSATADNGRRFVSAEIKSLNSKTIEIYLKMPVQYFRQELIIRNLLTQKLGRGKISVHLTIEDRTASPDSVRINTPLLKAYWEQLKTLSEELHLPAPALTDLLNLPGIVGEPIANTAEDDEEWNIVWETINRAGDELIKARQTEGNALLLDLEERGREVERLLSEIPAFEADRILQVKQRLKAGLQELSETFSYSEDRFQQEVIYYIEKYDINEEKVRLRSHLDALFDTLKNNPENQGRKLHFLAQEMHREVNTLGVKAYDANIQLRVVAMKDEIEKLKEQLMNIL